MLILLFFLFYIGIGCGMVLMCACLNKIKYMESLLDKEAPVFLIFLWPFVIQQIYNDNYGNNI